MDELELPGIRIHRNTIVIIDRRSGKEWKSLMPIATLRRGGDDYKPGAPLRNSTTSLYESGEGVEGKISCESVDGKVMVGFKMLPGENRIDVHAGPCKGNIPDGRIELEFPRGMGWTIAGEKGYLVLPIGMGAICDFSPARRSRVLEKHIYSGGQTGITMPLFGTIHDGKAIGCVVETPFDCKIRTEIGRGRRRVYAQTPVWVFDERTNSPRYARYYLLGKGDYVAIAKLYRREVVNSGRFVSLKSKARGNPEVESTVGSLLGHRTLSFSEPTAADPHDISNTYGFFRKALRSGFDRVIAHNVYRGEPSEMRDAARFARSLCPGFRLSVYENYLDIFRPGEQPVRPNSKRYPDWDESLIARRRDGSMRPNWRVRRRGKPDLWTYTVCPAKRLEVAQPQMEELFEVLGRGSIYIDVEGAVPLFDCFDERHPVTKEEDCAYRVELLRRVKELFGVVSTEALPQDFLAEVIEVGSYFSVFPYSGFGNSEFRIMPPMIPVPLHPLVWHGSILNQTGTGTNFYQSDPPHAALFGWLADTMDDKGRRIAYKLRGTAHAELVEHKFITGPRVIIGPDDAFHCDDVQMTRFSDGTVVIGNFASLPYRWRGRTIHPMDFLIINERLSLKITCPSQVASGGKLWIDLEVKNIWDREIANSRLVLLGQGLAHSETPLFQREVTSLGAGQSYHAKACVVAPDKEGPFWLVATLHVPDAEPWEVADIAECRAKGLT